MAIRNWSTGNLYQWHFVVGSGPSVIHFISRTEHLEIVPQIDANATSEQWARFVNALKADYARVGPDIKKVREGLEAWDIFLNPFARLTSLIDCLEPRLKEQTIPIPPTIPDSADKQVAAQWCATLKNFFDNTISLKTAALTARMLSPVWAESFVNLLLFVLGKAELKADRRVYDNALRQPIDVRVTSLHLHCLGFDRQVNRNDRAFKQFHTLMNARNDLLHGNIDPSALRCGAVWFDKVRYEPQQPFHQIPLFEDEKNLAFRLLESTFHGIEPKESLDDISTVRSFVKFVLTHVTPQNRDLMELVMTSPTLGWYQSEKRPGVLFSSFSPIGIINISDGSR